MIESIITAICWFSFGSVATAFFFVKDEFFGPKISGPLPDVGPPLKFVTEREFAELGPARNDGHYVIINEDGSFKREEETNGT